MLGHCGPGRNAKKRPRFILNKLIPEKFAKQFCNFCSPVKNYRNLIDLAKFYLKSGEISGKSTRRKPE